jgi:hypothetical protein
VDEQLARRTASPSFGRIRAMAAASSADTVTTRLGSITAGRMNVSASAPSGTISITETFTGGASVGGASLLGCGIMAMATTAPTATRAITVLVAILRKRP